MEPDYTTAFDALHTNNYIQRLKVLHAFSAPDIQHFMAVYIKFLELRYTMENHLVYRTFDGSLNTILDALCPFCSPAEQQQLKQISRFMDSFETAKAISETMELMKDIFPSEACETADESGEPSAAAFTGSPMMEQLLMGMLSEEQRAMFESLMDRKE